MIDILVANGEAFLTISAVGSVITGLVARYVIKPYHDNMLRYRQKNDDTLKHIADKLDQIENDQRANHVCAKQHTKELQEIKHDLGRGTQVMDNIKQCGIDTGTRLAKLEGILGEHLRKT